jgi:hypothetical protein
MSPNSGGWGGGGFAGVSANVYNRTHGAEINFGDLTPYLSYEYCAFLPNIIIPNKTLYFCFGNIYYIVKV